MDKKLANSKLNPNQKPIWHWSRLIQARVPLGCVLHLGANYLLEHYPFTLEIPLIILVWWELAKQFQKGAIYFQVIMTTLQLAEMYVINTYYSVFLIVSPLQFSATQAAVLFVIFKLVGVKDIDNIILNYLLFGITCVNFLIKAFPAHVMLTISMAIAGSDCIQYFVGKKVGKTKIVPKISPNKSLEGYIGAIILCNLINVWLVEFKPTLENLIFVNGMLLCGIFGDLFISWWKRNHSIKDTSALLTGHGGFLDRLDSHLAAWIWSLYFAIYMGYMNLGDPLLNTNFTGMNYTHITYLIGISWLAVWARFFYCAIFKGELV